MVRRGFDGVDEPDREGLPTRTLIIDLAVVEDRLRSLASRRSQAGPTPHSRALSDQLETHEREILRTLQRRRLPFRPVSSGRGTSSGPSGGGRFTW